MGFPAQGYLGTVHEVTLPKAVDMIGLKSGSFIPAPVHEITSLGWGHVLPLDDFFVSKAGAIAIVPGSHGRPVDDRGPGEKNVTQDNEFTVLVKKCDSIYYGTTVGFTAKP